MCDRLLVDLATSRFPYWGAARPFSQEFSQPLFPCHNAEPCRLRFCVRMVDYCIKRIRDCDYLRAINSHRRADN